MSHSSTEGSKVPAHAACSLCSYHTGNTFIERRINSNGESTFILLISAYQLHKFFIFKQPIDRLSHSSNGAIGLTSWLHAWGSTDKRGGGRGAVSRSDCWIDDYLKWCIIAKFIWTIESITRSHRVPLSEVFIYVSGSSKIQTLIIFIVSRAN